MFRPPTTARATIEVCTPCKQYPALMLEQTACVGTVLHILDD